MQGVYLKFYVQENRKHHGMLAYEWLLREARHLGLHGGSVFKAIAGFGRHGVIHADHFIELAGDLPLEVVFAVSDAEADALLAKVNEARLPLFYVRMAAEYGVVGS
jgi:PII-like signaling protein